MKMAFSLGPNTSALGATSTPAKPGGFGNFSFGGGAAAPGFGAPASTANTGFSTSFGAPSAFGSTSFGAPASTAPSFGGFGGTTTTAAGSSFAFGQQQQQQQPNMGAFGAPSQPATGFGNSTFGQPAAGSTMGGFGAAAQPATGFGASGFGTGGGFGGFGAAASAAAPGLTTTNTSTGFSGFGTGLSFNAPATSASAFSFNTPSFGATSTAPTAFGGFGSSFGSTFAKPTAGTGFGTAFGQPSMQQQQQQQPPQQTADEAFARSIFNVAIYGDERDTVIAKWNYLQAMWGTGKAFYAQNLPPVDITPQNYLCRFKAIGYSKMPGKDNKMGMVALVVNKSQTDAKDQQSQLISQLNQILGNKPNVIVTIDSIKAILDTKCQVVIFVQEKSQTSNEIKRILATDIYNFLNQPMTKNQLAQCQVEDVVAMITPDEDQLKEYLENPPKGIDPRLWKQAREDNPDPTKFIPVPIVGFKELQARIKCQETETETHTLYLQKVQNDLAELKQRHASSTAKILEHKRKLADLSHRILKIIVKQEITRKVGVALSPEEEMLRSKLENMHALVSAPTQYKGRLSELLSQMRMQRNQWNLVNASEYALDPDSAEEMKNFLCMQQKAMAFLIETCNKDMDVLKNIHEKMSQIVRE